MKLSKIATIALLSIATLSGCAAPVSKQMYVGAVEVLEPSIGLVVISDTGLSAQNNVVRVFDKVLDNEVVDLSYEFSKGNDDERYKERFYSKVENNNIKQVVIVRSASDTQYNTRRVEGVSRTSCNNDFSGNVTCTSTPSSYDSTTKHTATNIRVGIYSVTADNVLFEGEYAATAAQSSLGSLFSNDAVEKVVKEFKKDLKVSGFIE